MWVERFEWHEKLLADTLAATGRGGFAKSVVKQLIFV